MVDDETVVQAAATAAEDVVFSRFSRSRVDDLDVTVIFEDGILDVDVYLHVADPGPRDPDQIADDAALAARSAADDLLSQAE